MDRKRCGASEGSGVNQEGRRESSEEEGKWG